MLTHLKIVNFRNHGAAGSCFEFQHFNLLMGPNGSGKTSVLDAICYGLLGANYRTAADGKGAQSLIRLGAKQLEVEMRFEHPALQGVARARGQKDHTLQLLTQKGVETGSPQIMQSIILRELNAPHESLLALLDPRPLLSRPEKEQHEILVRLLRPPKITVPEGSYLRKLNVSTINDIEHLDRLYKELKDGGLRDAKREKKRMEGLDVKAPEWPCPGWTEDQMREQLSKCRAKRDELNKRAGVLDAQAKKAEANPALDAEQHAALETAVSDLKESLASKDTLLEDSRQTFTTLTSDRSTAAAKWEALTAELKRVERLKIEKHECPTCSCPIDQMKKDRAIQLQKLRGEAEAAEQAVNELDKEVRATREAITALKQSVDSIAQEIKATERELANAAGCEPPDMGEVQQVLDALSAAGVQVSKGEQWVERINAYKREQAEAERHAATYLDLTNEKIPVLEAAVQELERLKEGIIQAGIEPFLDSMKRFLKPFGLENVTFDGEQFYVDNRPAIDLSEGQASMFFEAAFRLAASKAVGFPLVLLDHKAPVSEDHVRALRAELAKAGPQVICTWTTSTKPEGTFPGIARYWFEDTTLGAKVELVR